MVFCTKQCSVDTRLGTERSRQDQEDESCLSRRVESSKIRWSENSKTEVGVGVVGTRGQDLVSPSRFGVLQSRASRQSSETDGQQ